MRLLLTMIGRGLPLLCFSVAGAASIPNGAADERLDCRFRGWVDHCPLAAEDRTAICVNDPKIYIGKRSYQMTLDYATGTALLNGIGGRILQAGGEKAEVVWDLPMFGRQELIREHGLNGVHVTLRSGNQDVGFSCVRTSL
jgi:hypothetical protein